MSYSLGVPAADLTLAVAGGAGVASGALLTVAASLWGQRREARREQGRWLRDQRIKAYIDFERAVDAVVTAWHAHERVKRRLAGINEAPMQKPKPAPDPLPLWSGVHVAQARIAMVGTPDVQLAANVVSSVAFFCWEHSVEPPGSIVAAFEVAAKHSLISRSLWARVTRRDRPNTKAMLGELTHKVEMAHGPFVQPHWSTDLLPQAGVPPEPSGGN